MVSEPRKQSMAWIETDYSKHKHFRWKIKWRLEHLGALGTMGETAPHIRVKMIYLTFQALVLRRSKVWVNGLDLNYRTI